MTLDDLEMIYQRGKGPTLRARDGLRAVVAALRDEMLSKRDVLQDLEFLEHCGNVFNQILGDAGEKVAERVGDTKHPDVTSPATDPALVNVAKMQRTLLRKWRKAHTDPAPDVCEWITEAIDPMGYGWMVSSCGHSDHERNLICQKHPTKIKCPSCGKPIRFVEAQR